MGRPEGDNDRLDAMTELGNGLSAAKHYEDALAVREAELSTRRRLGDSEESILVAQGNLANTYRTLGRDEKALPMRQEVYSGRLKLLGEEHNSTLIAALNCAASLNDLKRYEEAKLLLRKAIPVARRVLGEDAQLLLRMRKSYAVALYEYPTATLVDQREAATTLEEVARTARRVLGGAHPLTTEFEWPLQKARAALRAHESRQDAAHEWIREYF